MREYGEAGRKKTVYAQPDNLESLKLYIRAILDVKIYIGRHKDFYCAVAQTFLRNLVLNSSYGHGHQANFSTVLEHDEAGR